MKRSLFMLISITITLGVCASPAFAVSQAEQTRLSTIISRGDQEIQRRLTALNAAAKTLAQTEKLSATDKQTLTDEVNTTISGLTTLKAKLDADTTLADARVDAKSIVTGYRVYALVLPKVRLVKVADGQIALESKFEELSATFLHRFAELKSAGQDVSALEAALSNMNMKTQSAQEVSTVVQAKVISLQPSDYNSDHTILVGYRDQLKSAHDDLVAARDYAKSIVDGIKALTK